MSTPTFAAKKLTDEQLRIWQQVRKQQALFDVDAVLEQVRTAPLIKTPGLLFDHLDRSVLQSRMAHRADITERMAARCREIATRPTAIDTAITQCYASREALALAEGYYLHREPAWAAWAIGRIRALLAVDTWKAAVHQFCKHCDHVMANVGADLAYSLDLLGDSADDAFAAEFNAGLRKHLIEPYLREVRARDGHWTSPNYLANWKIMTHGETGLVACAHAHDWTDARELIALAVEGVLEILDVIPSQGDWPEGVNYWYATLFMGLRFALALRRVTDGKVDLLAHPRLDVTGDFGAMLVSPAGSAFNYGDNHTTLNHSHRTIGNAYPAECLLLLGAIKTRADWIAAARPFASNTPFWLAYDDPAVADAPPPRPVALFPTSGVATIKQGATFIALRSGDSEVGHSHLDANSFIVETAGQTLCSDEGCWPYAHFLGVFDTAEHRWNFDANATVGHNAILVDGQGQTYGSQHAGQVRAAEHHVGWSSIVADASACYPGLLHKWVRTLALVGETHLIIRDVIACHGSRHIEWLLHSPGSFTDDGDDTLITVGPVTARLAPLLPSRDQGWRISDVTRTSRYENSNTHEAERQHVRYRSFSTFRAAETFEYLFVMHLAGTAPATHAFTLDRGTWQLGLPSARLAVRPHGDTLALTDL